MFLVLSALLCIACVAKKEKVELGTLVAVPRGLYNLGSAFPFVQGKPQPDQAPKPRRVKLEPFEIEATAVTNSQFEKFVDETGYETDAEKFQWSFVMEYLLDKQTLADADSEEGLGRVEKSPHWVGVAGASWRHPEGPSSTIEGKERHPAVHMSWADAYAYCKWAGRRLPTEEEWEAAARGGLKGARYPWGSDPDEGEFNGWQGDFPDENSAEDGFPGIAPVDAFAPNPLGLYNTVGNVWEWVAGGTPQARPVRGGSYVDTIDGTHNHALSVAARMAMTEDSGGHNVGFRCCTGAGGGSRGSGPSGRDAKGEKKKKKKAREEAEEDEEEWGAEVEL